MMAIIALVSYILGGIVMHVTDKAEEKRNTQIYIIERHPDWVEAWMKHCDDNDLLYDSGLPIYADDGKLQIYKDAVEKDFIEDVRGLGYEIVERK